jgi:hypothetical protein
MFIRLEHGQYDYTIFPEASLYIFRFKRNVGHQIKIHVQNIQKEVKMSDEDCCGLGNIPRPSLKKMIMRLIISQTVDMLQEA